MPGFKDDAQHSRGKSLRIRVAGAVAATGLALTGCAPNTEARPVETTSQLPPTPDKPSTTASGTPTASETQTSAEFTPGATGKYSPEALAAIADDPEALVKAFQITGDTPEEIVTNARKALIGYLMASADESDYGGYRAANGFVNNTSALQYRNDMRDKYGGPACQGMNGQPCKFPKELEDIHQLNLALYSQNHGNSPDTTGLPADFMLGADTISNVKVIKGSIAEGIIRIQADVLSTNNYKDSIAKVVADNMASNGYEDSAAIYASADNWKGTVQITQTFQRVGSHWNIVSWD